MAERSRLAPNMPGYQATNTQPGTPKVNVLRERARRGLGTNQAEALAVQRLFRTTEEGARPLPHVMDVEDITRGLPMESDQKSVIHKLISETRADYGTHSQLRVPRLAHARSQLSNVLNTMGIDGDLRMEIRRRALAYWRRNSSPDYERKPMTRYVITKSQARSSSLLKAEGEEPPPKEESPKGEESKAKDGKSEGYNPVNVPQGPGGPKEKAKEKPKLSAKVEEHDDGHTVHIGEGEHAVEVNLHKDADFQHHSTEYAKHSAMFKLAKEHMPEKAEAHRHAANMHAKIANALHQAGQTNPHPARGMATPPEEGGEPDIFGGDALAQHMPGEDGGPPPIQDAESPGLDAQGQPIPGEPDGQRNEPGQDSENKPAADQMAAGNQGQVPPSPGEAPQVPTAGPPKKPGFGKSMVFVIPKDRPKLNRVRRLQGNLTEIS